MTGMNPHRFQANGPTLPTISNDSGQATAGAEEDAHPFGQQFGNGGLQNFNFRFNIDDARYSSALTNAPLGNYGDQGNTMNGSASMINSTQHQYGPSDPQLQAPAPTPNFVPNARYSSHPYFYHPVRQYQDDQLSRGFDAFGLDYNSNEMASGDTSGTYGAEGNAGYANQHVAPGDYLIQPHPMTTNNPFRQQTFAAPLIDQDAISGGNGGQKKDAPVAKRRSAPTKARSANRPAPRRIGPASNNDASAEDTNAPVNINMPAYVKDPNLKSKAACLYYVSEPDPAHTQMLTVANDDWRAIDNETSVEKVVTRLWSAVSHRYAQNPPQFSKLNEAAQNQYHVGQRKAVVSAQERFDKPISINKAKASLRLVVYAAISVHRIGVPKDLYDNYMAAKNKGKQSDRKYALDIVSKCSVRLGLIEDALRDNKLIVGDVLNGKDPARFVQDPKDYLEAKFVYLKSNVKRAAKTKQLKRAADTELDDNLAEEDNKTKGGKRSKRE